MKKSISIRFVPVIITVCLLLALCGCGKGNTAGNGSVNYNNALDSLTNEDGTGDISFGMSKRDVLAKLDSLNVQYTDGDNDGNVTSVITPDNWGYVFDSDKLVAVNVVKTAKGLGYYDSLQQMIDIYGENYKLFHPAGDELDYYSYENENGVILMVYVAHSPGNVINIRIGYKTAPGFSNRIPAAQGTWSEADLREFCKKIDKAYVDQDVDALGSLFGSNGVRYISLFGDNREADESYCYSSHDVAVNNNEGGGFVLHALDLQKQYALHFMFFNTEEDEPYYQDISGKGGIIEKIDWLNFGQDFSNDPDNFSPLLSRDKVNEIYDELVQIQSPPDDVIWTIVKLDDHTFLYTNSHGFFWEEQNKMTTLLNSYVIQDEGGELRIMAIIACD